MVASEQVAQAQAANHRRQQQRYWGSFIACGVGLAVVIAWVLLAKPADGWFGLPVALVGVPCAFGVLVLGLLLVATYRRSLSNRRGGAGVPLIAIEDPYSADNVMPASDVEQLSRLETLIRRQAEQR